MACGRFCLRQIRNLDPRRCCMSQGISCLDVLFAILAILCLVVTVACGVIVVREYRHSRGFDPATCLVTRIEDVGTIDCKYCGTSSRRSYDHGDSQSCSWSSYPCYQVWVDYKIDSRTTSGIIHSSAIQLVDHPGCSHFVCNERHSESVREVQKFLDEWPIGATRSCFYDTNDEQQLLTRIKYSKAEALHSLLWPLGATVAVIVGWVLWRLVRLERSYRERNKSRDEIRVVMGKIRSKTQSERRDKLGQGQCQGHETTLTEPPPVYTEKPHMDEADIGYHNGGQFQPPGLMGQDQSFDCPVMESSMEMPTEPAAMPKRTFETII